MRVHIGNVGVDAGLLMIGDPGYFVGKDATIHSRCDSWTKACDEVFCTPSALDDKNKALDVYGLGVAVATTFGDGVYPVYLDITKTGRRRLLVELD